MPPFCHPLDGYINYEQYFVDGTKIEANSNRYTFVWAKSTKRYKEQLAGKVKQLFEEIDELNAHEDEEHEGFDLDEMGERSTLTAEKLEKRINDLNEKLAEKPRPKKICRLIRTLERDCLERQRKYERYEEILGDPFWISGQPLFVVISNSRLSKYNKAEK